MCWWIKKKVISPETLTPKSTEKITCAELTSLLKNYVPTAQIIMADNWKYLCHYDDIALFLAQDQTNKMEWIEETRDCDDFAFRLKGQFSIPSWSGLALGICWTTEPYSHALNAMVTEDMKLWLIEPQSDEIIDNLKDIKIRLILM